MKTKDPKERFRLQAEAEKERQKAQKYVFDSKAKTQRDMAIGTKVLGKPHFFSEQGKQLYNKSLSAPIYSKDDIIDYNTIPLGYDKSKVVSDVNKLNEELLKLGKYDEVEGVTKKAGDLTVAEFAKIKRVPQEAQLRAYEMLYRGNDGFKAMLEESYPQLDWDNNEGQAMQMALTDMVTNAPLVKDEGVERRSVPNREMTDYQKRMLSLAERRLAKSESGEDAETYRQQIIGGIMNNDKESIDEMKAYLPSGSDVQYLTSGKVEKGIREINGKKVFTPTESKGDYNFIRVNIPEVLDNNNKVVKQGITEDISLSLGDAKNRLNAILSEYTGEKISPSKLNIEGGKPRGRQIEIKGQARTPTKSYKIKGKDYSSDAVTKAAEASGMTVEEYLKEANK